MSPEEGAAPVAWSGPADLRHSDATPSTAGGAEWSRRLRVRRSASAELASVCRDLDGTITVTLPDTGRCPRWCSAWTVQQIEHYADTLGTCPCPPARKAGAA